ncbi:MAG: FAD-linked oxidase C-terminal domain-containing protein [Candidatus Bipolaricaulaceae bacterium]
MIAYAVNRFVSMVAVLLALSFIIYGLMELIPGDPVTVSLGTRATEELVQARREAWGLDKPFLVRYGAWLEDTLLHGNVGKSFYLQEPVTKIIGEKLPVTLILASFGLVLAALVGIPLGALAAVYRGRLLDELAIGLATLGVSVPGFWMGLNFIFLFAVALRWFPSGGYVSPAERVVGWMRSLALPVLAIGLINAGAVARTMRSTLLEVLGQLYVSVARARPLADRLGSPLGAVLLGHEVAEGVRELILRGADRVYAVDHPSLRTFDADPYLGCLGRLVGEESPAILIAGATTSGRTLMPLLAAQLRTGLTADCTELDVEEETGLLLQTRPAIGGNVMATIKTPDRRPQLATVRPRSHRPAPPDLTRRGEVVTKEYPEEVFASRYTLLGVQRPADEGSIEDAAVVVTAGRGVGRPENLHWVRSLARALGGRLGASRAVVDQGWLPYPCQVGLSGKTVSPDLYIACGVSGAIQHLAGMRGHGGGHKQGSPRPGVPGRRSGCGRGPGRDPPAPGTAAGGAGVWRGGGGGASYQPVTPQLVSSLEEIVGAGYVATAREQLDKYGLDEIEDRYRRLPEAVVKPRTAQQVAAVMRLASRHRVPVTPRGVGTGLSGGAIPACGGIVLSLERMDRILEVDPDNMMVTVEPGVVLADMMRAVEARGLFYPVDVSTLDSCHVGGNVAENAGGARAVKYGLTGDWVYGVEVVTPTGELVRLGGKCVKDVTGYDLLRLLVGSEGTLAVITQITFRLTVKPRFVLDLLAPFDVLDHTVALVLDLLRREHGLAAVEFMDCPSLRAAEDYLNLTLPHHDCQAHLLLQLDGMDEDAVWGAAERVYERLAGGGAREVYAADNRLTRERLWRARRNIAEALKAQNDYVSVEDMVVPRARIPEMVRRLGELAGRHNLSVPVYGHIGDGNLHPTPVSGGRDEQSWAQALDAFLGDMFRVVRQLGGDLTAEHGVGLKRGKFLPLVSDEVHIGLMQRIKQA